MAYITFHPDGTGAWTAQLKEGENTIGRAEDNDIHVSEEGVSGYHCRVTVSNGAVTITDLNSTNGTLSNGHRIHQLDWTPGQQLELGPIRVRLDVATPETATRPAMRVATSTTTPPPAPAVRPAGLRIAGHAPVTQTVGTPEPVAAAPAETTPPDRPAPVAAPAGTHCRSHNRIPANWQCPSCHKYFCDLCVSTRATHAGAAHLCRGCGVECTPVLVEIPAETGERSFFARLGGAFLFPFRGAGVFILIFATMIFEGSSLLAGLFAIFLKMAITGYLFVFMQDVIHGTAVGEDKMPGLPEFDGLFAAFFKLLGTIFVSFLLPIGLAIAKLSGVEIPTSAFVASIFVSLLYFPMAFLAVAILDSVAAANPLLVVPSILRVPAQYLVTVLVIFAVYGVRLIGDNFAQDAKESTFTTTEMSVLFLSIAGRMLWSLVSVYLLTVTTRILGLLYLTQKEKLGW